MAASLVGAPAPDAPDASSANGNGRHNGHTVANDITMPINPARESTGPPP